MSKIHNRKAFKLKILECSRNWKPLAVENFYPN